MMQATACEWTVPLDTASCPLLPSTPDIPNRTMNQYMVGSGLCLFVIAPMARKCHLHWFSPPISLVQPTTSHHSDCLQDSLPLLLPQLVTIHYTHIMPPNIPPSASPVVMTLDAIKVQDLGHESSRLAVLDAARRLATRLETVAEQATRLSFEQPIIFAAVQVFVDVGIWEAWNDSDGGVKTADELARLAKVTIELGLVRKSITFIIYRSHGAGN